MICNPKQYSPRQEHKVDIRKPGIQREMAKAKMLFENFSNDFRGADLRDKQSVERAYDAALRRGVLAAAAQIRELIFGRDTTTYGVSYISDLCVSGCAYCPMRRDSIDVETGKPIKRKRLSVEDFILDTQEIIKDGHTHICFLAGDGDLTTKHPERMIPYLLALDHMQGISEIILNVTPQTTDVFRIWRNAVANKSLQFRVFQETYNREIYVQKHLFGPKADYDFRRESQSRAMDAGFDNYGFGVLLGLDPNFIQDILDLAKHAWEMAARHCISAARVCLPTANMLRGVNNVEAQHFVSPQANELAYALAKLAMPEVSIVSSERDPPEMLSILDKYATNRTVDVQPSVGGNLQQKANEGALLKQATVHPTDPESTKKDYESRGYRLLFDY